MTSLTQVFPPLDPGSSLLLHQLLPALAGDAGLLAERPGFLRDGRVVEFSQSFYRGDTCDFVAELSAP